MTDDNKKEPSSIGNGWRVKERKTGFRQAATAPNQQPAADRTRPAKARPRPANVQSHHNFSYETSRLASFSYRHVVLALIGLAFVITTTFLLWGDPDEKEVLTSLDQAPSSRVEATASIEQDIGVKDLTLDEIKTDEPPIAARFDKDRDIATALGKGGPLDEQPIQANLSSSPTVEIVAIKPSPRPQQATLPLYRVQVGALPTRAGAERLWNQSQQDHGELMAGIEPNVEAATTSNGPIYRLHLGLFQDRGEANDLCIELTKRQASCFVVIR